MSKIVPLDMSQRGLSQLGIPVLPHLVTHLYLNDNQLTSLPKEFFIQFHNLQWLDLRNNFLVNLPTKLPHLENKDAVFAEEGVKKKQVVLIKIESAEGREVPVSSNKMEGEEDVARPKEMVLHTILLQNNALHEIPSVLKQIPSLRVIQLHGNPCAKDQHQLLLAPKKESLTQQKELPQTDRKICNNSTAVGQQAPVPPWSLDPFHISSTLPGKKKDALVNGHVEKVQAITLQRQRDRQRQMEQIQVAREIQVSKDAEALQKFRRTFYAKGTSISKPRESPPMGLDRDKRVAQRSQIQFGAIANQPTENALDQLSAEMDRVLERRYQFEPADIPSLEEIQQSNQEVKRIMGNINKARILL